MAKSTTKLINRCTNKECSKVFCRCVEDPSLAKKIVKILSMYGESFNCKKIMKTDFSKEKLGNCIWIDSLIYVYRLICESREFKSEPSTFSLKNPKIITKISISDKRENQPAKIKPYQDLNHKFCAIMKKDLNEIEIYLLTGIIHFLLKKFQKYQEFNDFNLAIVILRYFNILGNQGYLDKDYYILLIKVFEVISYKIQNSVVSCSLNDHRSCDSTHCFLYFDFSKSDFETTVKILHYQIENSSSVDFRENQRLVCQFKALEKLKMINDRVNTLEEGSFVLESFFNRVNLKNEIKFTKLKFDSPLKYSFAIPLQIKAEILKIQNSELMKITLQEAFFKALFEGVTQPYLFISIRRDRIYKDTLAIILDLEQSDIRKQLKVKFQGEEGIDSGGIKKEFFQLLGHEIENDISLFTHTNNRIWFRNGTDLQTIETIGKLVGIALYNDVVLNIPFPSLLFKKLLRIPVQFDDLEEIEPEIYNSLKKLEECNDEELAFLDQNFTVDIEIQGKRENYELIPAGREVKVNKNNLHEFSILYFQLLTQEIIKSEFEAFSSGFFSVMKREFLQGLTSSELEKIIIGCGDIDFEIIKKNTIYNGYGPNNPIIESFWNFFAELKPQKKKRLIQFITGNDRLPVGGSNSLNLVIMRNGCDTSRLPSSQTCFNTLLLPEYASPEKMREKLSKAIDMTAGFFLM